jgi:hypothetical protein
VIGDSGSTHVFEPGTALPGGQPRVHEGATGCHSQTLPTLRAGGTVVIDAAF